MRLKQMLVGLLSVIFFIGFTTPADASYLVNMTSGGSKYIYSNNPESIEGNMVNTAPYGKYTVDQPLQNNTSYVSEFYHHNYTGASLRVGIAIKNNNNYTANVKVQNKAILTGKYTVDTASSLLRDFGNSNNDQTISIPANGTVVILSIATPTQYIVNGKVKFIPQSGGLSARNFFVSDNKYNIKELFKLPKATSTKNDMTSGFFNSDTRTLTIDAKTVSNFHLSAYTANPGEFETGTNVIGNSKLLGNYGIVYDVFLKNATGKRIKITPNLASVGATQAQIVLWTSANSWYRTSYVSRNSAEKYWLMAVPSDGHFKYSLPGGNFGNVHFEIVN
ncbi:hypothetical protein ACR3AM_006436 [Bacillus thuringiensis]